MTERRELGPAEMEKLIDKNMDVTKLTKKEASSIFLVYYLIDVDVDSIKKPHLVEK